MRKSFKAFLSGLLAVIMLVTAIPFAVSAETRSDTPVSPKAILIGDADQNGTITIADAIIIARIALGLQQANAPCDINQDGSVSIADAILSARQAMSLIDWVYVNDFIDQDPPDVEIYWFDTNKRSIICGVTQLVTFEAEIFTETALSENEVVLYQDGEVLGFLRDDGTNGDENAEDGIYTYRTTLSCETECIKAYQVVVREVASEIRNIGFYVPMTDEELAGMQAVDSAIEELVTSEGFAGLSTLEKANLVIELLTSLAEQGLVVADSICYDEGSGEVHFEYSTGSLGVVVLEQYSDVNTKGNGDKSQGIDGVKPDNAIDTLSKLDQVEKTEGIERNVLILNAFENEPFRRTFYNNLKTEWDAIGLNTTIDVDVTVEDMRSLASSDIDVIVFAMHGNHHEVAGEANERPVLCINEVVTSATDSAYDYEINTTRTVIRVVYTDGSDGYWITPQFFTDNYHSKALDGKMFFSESCCFYGCDCQTTVPDHTLANAFINRSAEVVVGYHNSVGANYSRDVMKIVIEESFNGATVNAAVTTAMERNGETDNWTEPARHKWAAYPIVAGNGSFVLRPDGLVVGSVKRADNSAAINNALIRAYDESNKRVASTRSDSSGSYSMSLSPGNYTLEISAGSYKKGKVAITVESDRTTYVETFLLVSNMFTIGVAQGTITNSVTGAPVSGVTVMLRKNWNNTNGTVVTSTTTNANGYYKVENLKTGFYTIEYSKSGFVTGYMNISVFVFGSGSTNDAVLTPVASNGVYRIVLTWGVNPNDLDSHVQGKLSDGTSFHVYYSHKSQYDGDLEVCNLDVDDVTSFGPETITLTPNTTTPYYYYIHRYAGSGSIATSGAQIKLYRGDTLLRTFIAPTDQGTADYWNVFAIVNGEIVIKDTISSSADISYAN